MKLNKIALATTLSAAFVLPLSSQMATAQTSEANNAQTEQVVQTKGKQRQKKMRSHSRSKHHGMRKLLRGLDLSTEQREAVFKIRHDKMPTDRSNKQAMRELKRQLQQSITADSFDAALVNKLSDQIGQLSTQIASEHANTTRKVYDVLTPEQRVKLKENMTRSSNRHGRHGRKHRG